MPMRDDIQYMLHRYREASEKRADAEGEYAKLDHMRLSVLAILMKQEAHNHPTAAAQEREARASDDYREYVNKFGDATTRLHKARAAQRERELAIELYRSMVATSRKEMETLHLQT